MKRFIAILTFVLIFALCPLYDAKAKTVTYANPVTYETAGENKSLEDEKDIGSDSDVNNINVDMNDGKLNIKGIQSGDSSTVWGTIFNKIKGFLVGLFGIAFLCFVAFFGKNLAKLGANSDNPSGRREALSGLLWTGIASALFGSLTIIVGLFWNALH